MGEHRRKGIALWQTKWHAIITDSTVLFDCTDRVITQHGEKALYQGSSTPRPASRVVLKRAWNEQQQQQQQDVVCRRGRGKLLAGQSPKNVHGIVHIQKEILHVVNTIEAEIPRAIKKTDKELMKRNLSPRRNQPGDRAHQDLVASDFAEKESTKQRRRLLSDP